MNTLKDLVNKVYTELQATDRINEYPDLTEKWSVADELQFIALDIMPNFVPRDKLTDFVEASEKNYSESTFKEFIPNYEEFLNKVGENFYQSLLLSLVGEE